MNKYMISSFFIILLIIFMTPCNGEKSSSELGETFASPIVILSNDDFNNYSTSGNGTKNNPWIIDSYIINESILLRNDYGAGRYCIYILHTSDWFTISNSTIINRTSSDGIFLYNVSHGLIINNNISYHCNGITIYNSNNLIISNNNISKIATIGIEVICSNIININNNSFSDIANCDISNYYSENITCENNFLNKGISINGEEPILPIDDEPGEKNNHNDNCFFSLLFISVSIFSLVHFNKYVI